MIQTILRRLPLSRTVPINQRYFLLILLVITVGSMVISLAIGLQQSVWFDEAYSILLAKQPLGQLLQLTSLDTHPPLYYIVLKGWVSLFGGSELALRSLSVLAMGGAVFVAGQFMRRWFGTRTALIAVLFVVLAPFLLRYGFEIRMYSFASLIGISATYILTIALTAKGRTQHWLFVGYALLVALGMYTLYYIALLWIGHVVWLFWQYRKAMMQPFRQPWLLAFLGSVVLFLPWLPTFVTQVSNGALAPISQAVTLENLLGIVSFNFVYQPTWQLGAVVSIIMVGILGILPLLFRQAYRTLPKKQRPYFGLLAVYILAPVATIALVSLLRPMYVERYLSHVVIGGLLLVGVSVAIAVRGRSRFWQASGLFLLAVQLLGVAQLVHVGNYNFQRLEKPSVATIASQVSGCQNGNVIMAADPYVAIELSYYLPQCSIKFYSSTDSLTGGYAPLSRSPNRIARPSIELNTASSIAYVYYGQAELAMPPRFIQSSRTTHGNLTIARFTAE